MPEVFDILDDFVKAGKIRHYGVSVEKVEDALKAIEFPGVQIRANYFQHFPPAPQRVVLWRRPGGGGWGSLPRVPLSSGMLTGKLTRASVFEAEDHRTFNRHGEAFDRGRNFFRPGL